MAGLSATAEAQAGWARLAARRGALLGAGVAVLAACFLLDVATGPAMLPLGTVAASVLGAGQDPMVEAIIWAIRLPVAIMALLVGAALGLTGAVMQTILNNPMASSYTLGVSAGAGFGAALVIVFGAALPLAEGQAGRSQPFSSRGSPVPASGRWAASAGRRPRRWCWPASR